MAMDQRMVNGDGAGEHPVNRLRPWARHRNVNCSTGQYDSREKHGNSSRSYWTNEELNTKQTGRMAQLNTIRSSLLWPFVQLIVHNRIIHSGRSAPAFAFPSDTGAGQLRPVERWREENLKPPTRPTCNTSRTLILMGR